MFTYSIQVIYTVYMQNCVLSGYNILQPFLYHSYGMMSRISYVIVDSSTLPLIFFWTITIKYNINVHVSSDTHQMPSSLRCTCTIIWLWTSLLFHQIFVHFPASLASAEQHSHAGSSILQQELVKNSSMGAVMGIKTILKLWRNARKLVVVSSQEWRYSWFMFLFFLEKAFF